MAWYNNRNRYYGNNGYKKKKRRFSKTEEFAFQLARVQEGLSNPNSKISEAFDNGKKTVHQEKKRMF